MMERPQDGSLPTLKADVETLKRELDRMWQTVKTTCSERRERTPTAVAVGMAIKGK